MKKTVFTLVFLVFVIPVFAEVFFEPQWEEFCPKRYVNINPNSWHYTLSGKYWALRKKIFEQRLAKCNSLSGEKKEACYSNLRDIETSATQLRNQERGTNVLKYMMINSMF